MTSADEQNPTFSEEGPLRRTPLLLQAVEGSATSGRIVLIAVAVAIFLTVAAMILASYRL